MLQNGSWIRRDSDDAERSSNINKKPSTMVGLVPRVNVTPSTIDGPLTPLTPRTTHRSPRLASPTLHPRPMTTDIMLAAIPTPTDADCLDLGALLAPLSREDVELMLVKIINKHPEEAGWIVQVRNDGGEEGTERARRHRTRAPTRLLHALRCAAHPPLTRSLAPLCCPLCRLPANPSTHWKSPMKSRRLSQR